MRIEEITSGTLPFPNIPDFKNPKHECDMDGYQIMSSLWKGYFVVGILDENNQPKSYCILEPEKNGYNKFVEIHTIPEYAGNNLAAIIMLSLKGKLGIKLRIDPEDVVSKDGRALILAMVKNGRITVSFLNGPVLTVEQLSNIFGSLFKTDCTLIIEGHAICYSKYDKDQKLNPMWYIRENVFMNGKHEIY